MVIKPRKTIFVRHVSLENSDKLEDIRVPERIILKEILI
jgi:hypothetical protein